MFSLQARFARGTVILLVLFSLLLAALLDRTFDRTLVSSEENRLEGLVYSFLSVMDVSHDGSVQIGNLPESLSDIKNISVAVIDENQKILWSTGTSFLVNQTVLPTGQWKFEHLQSQNHAMQLAFGVAWEAEQSGRDWKYSIWVRDSGDFYRSEMKKFHRNLWLWLPLGCLVLLLLQLILLRLGFRPLAKIAQEVSMIEKGKQHKFESQYPKELAPLTTNINSLLRHERSQQTRYQQALDNLAHALKTPLTAMNNLSTQKTMNDEFMKDMKEQVARAREIVDYQLAKAKAVGRNPFATPVAVHEIVEKISRSIQKVYSQKNLRIDIRISENMTVKMDTGDLFELLGNIIENAAKYCKGTILIYASDEPNVEICVEDDGPGFQDQQIYSIIQRGVRQDQRTEGSGIGLSVAFEIISVFGGALELSKSPVLGGALVKIRFS